MLKLIYDIPLGYYAIAGFINFVTCLFIGLFVYSKNKKAKVNQTFAYFCFTLAVWSFFYFIWLCVKEKKLSEFFLRTCMISVAVMPATFTHFIFYLLHIKINKKIMRLNYLVGIIIGLTVYTPFYAYDFKPFLVFPYWGRAAIAFDFHLVHFFCNVIYAHYKMFQKVKISGGEIRTQVKYVLIGTCMGYVGGISNYLCWYRVPIPPFPVILVSGYVVVLAYAIIRHQLMNIEVIVKKTLVFAGLFASAFAILVLPTLVIQEFIVSQMGISGRVIGLSISAMLIVLIYKRLENFLVNITDKFLFQKKYDYKELLKTFTTEVLSVLDLKKLVELTTAKLTGIMKIESCSVLLFDKTKNEYNLAASRGITDKNIVLTKESTLTTFLGRTRSYLSTKHQGKHSPLPKRIVEDMNRLKLELAIPLIIHDDMIGILTLGKKKSDEDYSQDDMDIILPLASTLAIAISNAEVLDELGKTQAEAAQREKMAVIGTLSAGIKRWYL